MKLFVLILISLSSLAQTLSFDNGKTLSLKAMKEKYQVQEIEVWNPYIRKLEKYSAFDMKKILNDIYQEKWKSVFSIYVETKDNYTPIIEVYKFKERRPYLAFAKVGEKGFDSIFSYKDKLIDLSPFYLIWIEDYKADDETKAARRHHHWPYKITKFGLLNQLPQELLPIFDTTKKIIYGYKNYLKQCISCHALKGIGGKKSFELLGSEVMKKEDQYLHQYISNPRKINPKAKMPAFPLRIEHRTDRIKNIVKYLRYLEKGPPKKVVRKSDLDSLIEILEESEYQ
jgi:hypothetical protein